MVSGGTAETAAPRERAATSEHWWVVLLLEVVAGLVFVTGVGTWLLASVLSLGGTVSESTTLSYVVFVIPLHVLAPAAVYFDRRYVAAVSEWKPSRLYYLTFVTGLGDLLAIAYLFQRHRYLGTP